MKTDESGRRCFSTRLNRKEPEEIFEGRPLVEHLNALRKMLAISFLSIAAAFLVMFFLFSKQLVTLVERPLTDQNIQIIFTGVSEAFAVQMKLSLIAGAVAASPLVFASIWMFIRPALYRKERFLAGLVTVMAVFLFGFGVYFAYQYVFFLAVNFFVYSSGGIAQPMISLGAYVDFLLGFLLPFGVTFEMPVIVVFLTRLGLVTVKTLRQARKFVILGIFTLAALLTPPDVISQMMLGAPLWILFEIGVFCSWILQPRTRDITEGN